MRAVSCGGCEELEPVCLEVPGRFNCQGIELPFHLKEGKGERQVFEARGESSRGAVKAVETT
jgi:hypothetical protein